MEKDNEPVLDVIIQYKPDISQDLMLDTDGSSEDTLSNDVLFPPKKSNQDTAPEVKKMIFQINMSFNYFTGGQRIENASISRGKENDFF